MRRGSAGGRPEDGGTSREDREEGGLVMERDGRGDAALLLLLLFLLLFDVAIAWEEKKLRIHVHYTEAEIGAIDQVEMAMTAYGVQ